MNEVNNLKKVLRGGIHFRLFLFLIILPFSGFSQVKLHYASNNLKLNLSTNTIVGRINIKVSNLGTKPIDTLNWIIWPNAYQRTETALSKELLEDQSVRMRFASDDLLGYFSSYSYGIQDNREYQTFNLNMLPLGEVLKMRVNLESGQETWVYFDFVLKLPTARFNGFGFSENNISLSHWLPRLSADSVNASNPTLNSKNREAWFLPATYDLTINSSVPAKVSSNLTSSAFTPKSWRFYSDVEKFDALINLQEGASEYSVPSLENDIKLHFVNDFPPFNQSVSWQQISEFLSGELNWVAPEKLNLLFTVKKGLKSSGSLILINKGLNQDDLEGEVVEEIVSVIAREKLLINPKKHPWLVEGMANYYKHLYFQKYYPEKRLLGPFANSFVAKIFDVDHYPIRYQNRMLFLYMARQGLDQPLSDEADQYSRANREAIIKGKSSMVFSYMRSYTGERDYKRGIYRWIQEAEGENGPDDLVESLEYFHNRDLSWVLGDLYSSSKKLDYAITRAENCSSVYTATIKNKGDLVIPYSITGIKNENEVLTEWFKGHEKKKTVQIHLEDYQKVKIDAAESMPEFTQKNNQIKTSGIFKTVQPLKLQFYTSFENPNKTQIFWLPSIKYNAYDKLLLGAQFYNTNLFLKPFEYRISPDYSTGTGKVTGMASFKFNWLPTSNTTHLISLGFYARYYHYAENLAYTRFSPTLTFNFRKSYPRSEWIRTLRFRLVAVDREVPQNGIEGETIEGSPNYQIIDIRYKAEKGSAINPFIGSADVQISEAFSKLSFDVKQRWRLTRNHLLTARIFSGVLFNHQGGNVDEYFQFGMSGTQDYLFDYYLIGRSDNSGIWSQQFFVTDGGFKSQTNSFGNGVVAGNLNMPFFKFFGAFGDIGYQFDQDELFWDYGIYLEFIPDFIEVYFPIQNNNSNLIAEPEYYKQIRFVLNLQLDAIMNRIRRGFY